MDQNKLKKLVRELINKQFQICGIDLTYDDVTNNKIPNWYSKYTCTEKQNKKWREFGVKFLIKNGFTKKNAQKEMNYFNLDYGLRLKNDVDNG